MKAPAHWQAGRGGLTAALLTPASWLYRIGTALNRNFGPTPRQVPVPVICIGNVTAGGAGKTPVALDIAARLAGRGLNVHFLSRGYGGRLTGPLRVDPATHAAADVGDEPLLLAEAFPTWIGADRGETAERAVADGAQALVMDDGFQNFTLAKTLSLLVLDGGFGVGNGMLIPAGPLREPLDAALARADAVVRIGADATGIDARIGGRKPLLAARLRPGPEAAGLKDRRYLAFTGIGRPEKFFDTVEATGIEIAGTAAFADHHPFTDPEIAELRKRAADLGAGLITTAKDRVRLAPAMRDGIDVLTVHLEWEDQGALETLLSSISHGTPNAG